MAELFYKILFHIITQNILCSNVSILQEAAYIPPGDKMKKWIGLILVCGMILALLLYSGETAEAMLRGLRLCGSNVIPALFPIMVGTRLLTALLRTLTLPKGFTRIWQRCFGVSSNCAYGFILSLLGSYPVGAAVITQLYESKAISKEDAERSLCFCNNSGPGFFLGVVGAIVLEDMSAGILLYVIHVISALLIAVFHGRKNEAAQMAMNTKAYDGPVWSLLLQAIQESCYAMLQICGMILFFSVLGSLAEKIGLFSLFRLLPVPMVESEALLRGMLELTGGIFLLKGSSAAMVFAAFLMGWGGLCVHFQAAALWRRAGLAPKGYYRSKLLQAFLSAGLAWPVLENKPVYSIIFIGTILVLRIILGKIRNHTGNTDRYAL
ncbi:MAG: hypothetical protein IJA48_03555 [Oscillospiraceae bacterium]|nr:hypothetical protein [Oscillospiraceae bacterium]